MRQFEPGTQVQPLDTGGHEFLHRLQDARIPKTPGR